MRRSTVAILAAMLAGGPAAAQNWQSHGWQWPQIDCAQAHIAIPGQTVCRQGPIAGVTGGYTVYQCAFEQWFAYAESPAGRGAVNVFMRQPGSADACYVNPFADSNAALNAFAALRNGSNRSSPTEAGGFPAVTFTSASGENCAGFLRYGARWQGGYTYSLRGIFCAPKGSPLSPTALQSFVNRIVVGTR
jgi:hypothetical protein